MVMIEWYWAMAMMIGLVVSLLFSGFHIAFAFFAANIVGVFVFMRGHLGLAAMPIEFVYSVSKYAFVPVALFILMGEILFQTGVAYRAINAIDHLIKRVPGRLSVVSIVGGTIFSSLTGSTISNTAIMGSVMLPEMLKRNYHPTIAIGPIMAVGGIAMLIPPSALAVLLASLAEGSIKDLLIAGIMPGLLMATLFFGYVTLRCWLNPSLAPVSDQDLENDAIENRWRSFLFDVLPLFAIFAVVVGSIVGRIAAPEEAAALGCITTTIACAFYRKLTFSNLMTALRETAKINTVIVFIIAGSLTFSQVLQVSGATSGFLRELQGWELTSLQTMVVMMLVLLFLGAFMDQISMMLLTLPFFLPLAAAAGIDILWLLVMMLIAMEISLMSPPFGLLLYVMKGVSPPSIGIGTIYRAAFPFLLIELFVLGLLLFWPNLAIWLPSLIR
ncbi:MAG: SLC13 family permease [Rhizobiaceae bacterium]